MEWRHRLETLSHRVYRQNKRKRNNRKANKCQNFFAFEKRTEQDIPQSIKVSDVVQSVDNTGCGYVHLVEHVQGVPTECRLFRDKSRGHTLRFVGLTNVLMLCREAPWVMPSNNTWNVTYAISPLQCLQTHVPVNHLMLQTYNFLVVGAALPLCSLIRSVWFLPL